MPSRFILVFILLFAGFVRVYNIGNHGPFTDEKFTLLNVHGICVGGYNQTELTDNEYFTPKDFWKSKDLNDHYQAIARSDFGTHFSYGVLLKYWIKAFGLDDGSVRMLGVVFNLISILLIFWFCQRFLKSSSIGLISASLLAIDPLFISQSRFARSYTLSFLLVILGTIIFYQILKSRSTRNIIKYGIIYALIASLALLNHYLNFIIFLGHVIVAIVFVRNKSNWFSLLGAGAFTLLVMAYWMNLGGGQWSMQFLNDKNALHLQLANLPIEENPMSGAVVASSVKNVIQRSLSIFFDSNLVSYDLYHSIHGIINLLILTFLTIGFYIINFFKIWDRKKTQIAYWLLLAILGIVLLPGIYKLSFLTGGFMIYTFYRFLKADFDSDLRLIILLSCLLPVLYVVFDAFKSGHTTSLAHRYIGVAIPFLAIAYGIGLYEIFKRKSPLNYLFVAPLLFQLYLFATSSLKTIMDISPIYSFRDTPRVKNPYQQAGELVVANYQKGDTLLIPSYGTNIYSEFTKDDVSKNITDAQYLNLYLPKDAEYIEKIDTSEKDLLILAKSSGERITLFNFEGSKYRY